MTRKFAIMLSLVVGLFMAANANAQYSRIADIVSTSHNMSSTGPGSIKAVSNTQICYYCHVPHQMLETTDPAVTLAPTGQCPLWNKYIPNTASYGVYSSPSFDAPGTDIADVGGAVAGSANVTNLCLSCHDGAVGVNTLYKGQSSSTGHLSPNFGAGNNVPVLMPADVQTGSDTLGLRDEHPLNFTYDATLAAKTVSLVVPVVNNGRTGFNTSSGKFLPLFANKMQCATCHDPHGVPNGTTANNGSLLNFDLNIVAPNSAGVGPIWTDLTPAPGSTTFSGSCTLRCHSKDHNDRRY